MNNKAEDPNLWNDAQEAQKLMRERQQLADGIAAVEKFEREVADQVGLIELGEAEGDQGVVTEAENALKALKKEIARREL